MKPGEVTRFPIEKEYEKNQDIKPDDVRALRQWLDRQPHLPGTISDLELLITLHCCELSSEISKQVLDLHFTLRTLFTSFFTNRTFDRKLEHCLNTILLAPLESPTKNNYRAIYCRLLDNDPRNFNFQDAVKAFMMTYDMWQQQEGTWPGFVIVIDMDKTVVGHLAKLDLMSLRQTLYFLQEAMLIRLKEVHFMNAPSFMDKLMMMLKPFMKKELMDIIRIHQVGANTMDAFIEKSAFPKESGGHYKDNNTLRDELIDKMKANEQFFKEEAKNRVQESLRPGKPQTIDNLFGIQGSFKKLDID